MFLLVCFTLLYRRILAPEIKQHEGSHPRNVFFHLTAHRHCVVQHVYVSGQQEKEDSGK